MFLKCVYLPLFTINADFPSTDEKKTGIIVQRSAKKTDSTNAWLDFAAGCVALGKKNRLD